MEGLRCLGVLRSSFFEHSRKSTWPRSYAERVLMYRRRGFAPSIHKNPMRMPVIIVERRKDRGLNSSMAESYGAAC
jgi:hypothetical protein